MGRDKKYLTKDDKYQAELRWKREWYARNKTTLKEKRMKKYYAKKINTK